jgi:hypothetical protein
LGHDDRTHEGFLKGDGVDIERWLQGYRRIWVDRDESRELLEQLFSEDATIRPRVIRSLEPPYTGLSVIETYIRQVLPQVEIQLMEYAEPIVDGDRSAVETWLYGSIFGKVVTEAMCTVLRFTSDGRCTDLRDYAHAADGIEPPYPGWS